MPVLIKVRFLLLNNALNIFDDNEFALLSEFALLNGYSGCERCPKHFRSYKKFVTKNLLHLLQKILCR